VDVVASVEAPVVPQRLWSVVSDLATYPRWVGIVHRAEPAGDGSWDVELRGRVGPFARSKRLRMERTTADEPGLVVFERRELDDRRHAAWRLQAQVVAQGSGSLLTMTLHYGGSMFGAGVLERLLGEQIESSRQRLLDVLSGTSGA
jgi:uncharacterized protein YndB with AHSA1/START domain